MTDQQQAYAVQLVSKYTGETCWLGAKHPTREAALEYVEREVCKKCNRVELYPVPVEWQWVDRRDGFRKADEPMEDGK